MTHMNDHWHLNGSASFWQFCRDGYDISGQLYAEDDADEKRLWEGPDGPSEVWTRDASGEWTRET